MKKAHTAVRLDDATIAKLDALLPGLALPGRPATRSDALRAVILAGLEIGPLAEEIESWAKDDDLHGKALRDTAPILSVKDTASARAFEMCARKLRKLLPAGGAR